MKFISTFIDGLSLGSVYALIALGYTMVYGIAKMLNFAHGDIMMVGAYAALLTLTKLYNNLILAIVISMVVCLILGVVTEKIAYKPLRGASPLAVLITAIGVSYLLQSIAQLKFGATPEPIVMPTFKPFIIGNLTIKGEAVITLIVSAALMAGLNFFVSKTKTGRSMLAVSEDKNAAKLMGININGTITLTFAIGSALAAVASAFYLMMTPVVQPTLGSMPGIKAFVAAVLGGIGSIPGAMVGGLILGVIEQYTLSFSFLSPYTDAIVFSILIIVLLIKPTGLFGKQRIEKV